MSRERESEALADEWYALDQRANTGTDNEGEDLAAIGHRDGYAEAVQTLDVLTGGDGEYRYCTVPDDSHCPDPPAMIRRVLDRLAVCPPSTPVEPATPTFNETGQSLKVADLEAVREAAAKVAETLKSGPIYYVDGRPNAAIIVGGHHIAAAIRSVPIKGEKG